METKITTILKWSFLPFMLLCICLSQGISAQETTVFLRNGSIVKGILSRSGERMRVETPNGSIIYFTQNAVKDMIAEDDFAPATQQATRNRNATTEDRFSRFEDYSDDNGTSTSTTTQSNRSRQSGTGYGSNRRTTSSTSRSPYYYDIIGYRGFVDLGYTIGLGDYGYNRFDMTTSHGYQFDPYFFLGAGIGFQHYKENLVNWGSLAKVKFTMSTIPIFADFRANFTEKGPIIPFAGLKAGYTIGIAKVKTRAAGISDSVSETKGLGVYLVPSVGAKYMVTPSIGINLSLGYTLQFATYELLPILDDGTKILGGITIKAGVEF